MGESLQNWQSLKTLELYCYGPPFVGLLLAGLVHAAPSLWHVNKVILCSLQGPFPPCGPPELIEELQRIWHPCEVKKETGSVSVNFVLQPDDNAFVKGSSGQVPVGLQPSVVSGVMHEDDA